MLKAITHFDQVPLGVVIEIMEREIHKKAALAFERTAGSREANLAGRGALNERGQALKVHSPVDIFRIDAKGALWLESSRTIDEARARIEQLGAQTSGEYMLLNQTTGSKVTIRVENAGAGSDRQSDGGYIWYGEGFTAMHEHRRNEETE
ncbi:MAG TPA: hypothetical protein VIH72_01725 [Candidatus Acidoferrales bacterium]|jgi:hypothetical protein